MLPSDSELDTLLRWARKGITANRPGTQLRLDKHRRHFHEKETLRFAAVIAMIDHLRKKSRS